MKWLRDLFSSKKSPPRAITKSDTISSVAPVDGAHGGRMAAHGTRNTSLPDDVHVETCFSYVGGARVKIPAGEARELLKNLAVDWRVLPDVAMPVESIADEYVTLYTSTCDCRGFYAARPVKRVTTVKQGGRCFDCLSTFCLLCGSKRDFIFDISSFYGHPSSRVQEEAERRRDAEQVWFTGLAHAATRIAFSLELMDPRHADMYFVMRDVLGERLSAGGFEEPLDTNALRAEVGRRKT